MKKASKKSLERFLSKIISLDSRAVTEYVKGRFSIDDVYRRLIPEMVTLSNKESLAAVLRTWPISDERLVHSALRNCKNQQQRHILAKALVENRVRASMVFMEQDKKPVLHSLIETQEFEFAISLVEEGADVNAENGEGETPLSLLARWGPPAEDSNLRQECLKLVRQLLSKGAGTQGLDQKGRSLCLMAVAAGDDSTLLDRIMRSLRP